MTTTGVRLPLASHAVEVARRVTALGGMFSSELGIDLDAGEREISRWFLAATLFGTRISARTAERTFTVLDGEGVTATNAAETSWDALVDLLDRGGYTRYDYRTATRLQQLSQVLRDRYGGQVGAIQRSVTSASELEAALDALPGWGEVTVGVFLRELRGVWEHADPPLSELVLETGRHLGVLGRGDGVARLRAVAEAVSVDVRELECALVRLGLAHRRAFATCPGGRRCRFLPVR